MSAVICGHHFSQNEHFKIVSGRNARGMIYKGRTMKTSCPSKRHLSTVYSFLGATGE